MTDKAIEAAIAALIKAAGVILIKGQGGALELPLCPDDMRAAIVAYEAAKWRPIEEAPKDGTSILVSSESWGTVWRGHYRSAQTEPEDYVARFGEGWTRENYSDINLQPTRFQPLPEPPKES